MIHDKKLIQSVKEKIPNAKINDSSISVGDSIFNFEFLDDEIIFNSVVMLLSNPSKDLDKVLEILQKSCLGRGTNYGWFGIHDNKSLIFYKKVKVDESYKNIDSIIGNIMYIIDEAQK